MAILLSLSNTLMSSSILFLAAYMVLSPTKFGSLTSLVNKNKSFTKILNKMGPNIEARGIPDKSIHSVIYFYNRFLRFKNECTKVTASSDKPYTLALAKSKSWGIQSKLLERSIRTAPRNFLSV